MDKDSRFTAVQNFAELLDDYKEMITLKEIAKSLSKAPDDYYAEIANLLDKTIDSQRAVLLALYESTLL